MAINWGPSSPSAGGRMGEAIGTGLSSGIQALTNWKLSEMQKEATAKKLMPIAEKLGLPKEVAYNPQLFAKMAPEAMKQNADAEWRNDVLGGGQPGQPNINDMSAEELSRAAMTAPKGRQESLRNLINVKLGKEKDISAQAMHHEEGLLERVNNAGFLNGALDELEEFAKENPDYFGPYIGRVPSLMTSSMAQRRDQLIKNVVDQMLSMKGALGRGTNLIVNIKEQSKPRASMNPKELFSAINTVKKLPNAVFAEADDYEKMKRNGKLSPDFMSQLINRSVNRYRTGGIDVEDSINVNNEEELNSILDNPKNKGKIINYQGQSFTLGE